MLHARTHAHTYTYNNNNIHRHRLDPGEHFNVATQNVDIFNQMLTALDKVQATVYSPDRGNSNDGLACDKATSDYGDFWGPFIL